MKQINEMMLAVGIAVATLTAAAQDVPSVPKICYENVDAIATCLDAQISSPVAQSTPDAVATLERTKENLANYRSTFPEQLKNKGVRQLTAECETSNRQYALDSVNSGGRRLQMAQDSEGAAKCKAASDSLGSITSTLSTEGLVHSKEQVPGVCYRVLNSGLRCAEAYMEAQEDSNPSGVAGAKIDVDKLKAKIANLPLETKVQGAQSMAESCNGPGRANMLNGEMGVIYNLQAAGENAPALKCIEAMNTIR